MTLLVVAATSLELAAALEAPELKRAPQGQALEISACGRALTGLVCGVGVVNAALHLGRALERGGVDGVLNFGVAGSFDLAAHPLGAARLVAAETWPEYGLLFSGAASADARGLGFPLCGAGGGAVFERLELDPAGALARLGLPATGWDAAESLTVSGVSADAARTQALHARYGAGLENMEGFALAYAARLAGTPFAELRVVSNEVGARPPLGWDLPGALAALGQAARRLLSPASA